ncbi:CPBP family intramembrane glutamic endopeptidase [Sinisalibacter lacisalsi]|nr:type II CAAX endopeptidase family protein [Sinisalibacter lacisalsi]
MGSMLVVSETVVSRDLPRRRLWAEFLGFFLVLPVSVAVLLPATAMFPVLFFSTMIGIVLLHLTPGFRWRDLLRGWHGIDWRAVAVFALIATAVSLAVLLAMRPEAFLMVFRLDPWLWLAIMVFYPLVSALPQEIVFRPLFFRRYGAILPPARAALVLNAAFFSLAHLLYWNWIVATMTFAGGLVFAWAYEERRSFPMAVILHAIAGNILFTVGMGVFFYSGNVVRPF